MWKDTHIKLNLLWDGWIFNNGVYDADYLGTWSAWHTSANFQNQNDYCTIGASTIHHSATFNSTTSYVGGESIIKRNQPLPVGYSNIEIVLGNASVSGTYPPQVTAYDVELRNANNGVLLSKHLTQGTSNNFDISQYSQDEVYLAFVMGIAGGYSGVTKAAGMDIKSIRMTN